MWRDRDCGPLSDGMQRISGLEGRTKSEIVATNWTGYMVSRNVSVSNNQGRILPRQNHH